MLGSAYSILKKCSIIGKGGIQLNTASHENVWVIIPAYNEAETISQSINDAGKYVKNIVVVDDSSCDYTYDVAVKSDAIVLRHCINLGQGAALQTGTEFALSKGAEIIIHFDGDGQHVACDIPNFISMIKSGFDVILGSRFLGTVRNIPFFKKIILRLGIIFTWMFSGLLLSDTHNGFRAFSRKAASLIKINENGMAHASEILHEIKRLNMIYKEIPVEVRYSKYSILRGQSCFNGINIIKRMVWMNLFLK